MWDALVDRYGGTTNQFPNDAALETMDFRNPNNLHPWMQGNTDDQSNKFPILNAYLKARELKRTEEPMAADYVSKKLYGMEYKTLLQQEKDNLNGRAPTAKTMPRVFAIAQHLAGGHGKANVIIDSEVIRPDAIPGYGIVDRSDFHKNSGGLERKRDSLLGNRRTGNSVLTQLWCTCGTCGMFALAPKPALASSARPSGPKHSDDPQPAPWWLVLPACWLRTVNFSRASLQGLRAEFA